MSEAPVETIRRWEAFGGSWVVIDRTGNQVTVSLRRCDGGEEQQRLTTSDEELLHWLDGRTSSSPAN
jgi:hypothetical protein